MFLLLVYVIFLAASAHAWAEVCHHTAAEVCHRQPLIYGQLTQALLHWQYWLKNHWPKRPFKHWINPSLDGWQSQLSLSKDQGHPYIHAFKKHGKYFTQSFRYIHINNRDLPQSFQVPGSIDNTTHTRLLRPPMHTRQIIMHTDLISNSAILCNNFVSLLSDL